MTSDSQHNQQDPRTEFDEAARLAHAASLDSLSPRVRAQLAQRRRAALAESARPSIARRWPMLALGSAAALTLVIGLFGLRGTGDTGTQPEVAVAPTNAAAEQTPAVPAIATAPQIIAPAPAPAMASTGTPEPVAKSILVDDELQAELLAAEFSGDEEAMGFDSLEESPDFYLWLGSDNAQADVTELL